MQESQPEHDRLPRLAAAAYQGHACVHWSMTMEARATGWLDDAHHAVVRELLLHTCHRYHLACPAYCLMPDHGHFLWIGLDACADQRLAAAWFRRNWNARLAPGYALQRQAYDHVLRANEREHGAFAVIAEYVLRNAERAGLLKDVSPWPYAGAVFPGVWPLEPHAPGYWERFWREHGRRVGAERI